MDEERQRRIEATRRYAPLRMEFDWGQPDSLLRFGRALADPLRLRMLGMLAERPMYGQELAETLNVKPPTITHHLNLLKAARLINERRENNYHYYSLNEENLQHSLRALTVENLKRIATMVDGQEIIVPSDDEERVMVQAAFFRDGWLLSIPTHTKKRRYVLEKIAQAFEWGRLYDEKEVNALLRTFHDDIATLRRKLVDEQLMMRENGRYWLIRPNE